jgi:hypothetical protein
MLKYFREKRYIVLLAISFLFTALIPSLVIWEIPSRLPYGALHAGAIELMISFAFIRAMALFIIDIFIKITLLCFIFKGK